jgi:hypothetical protein
LPTQVELVFFDHEATVPTDGLAVFAVDIDLAPALWTGVTLFADGVLAGSVLSLLVGASTDR